MIPILNLTRQYEKLRSEIEKALTDVAASGHYILGPNVKAFEEEMAAYLGVQHVIGCASGTDALYLALKALKIGSQEGLNTRPDQQRLPDEVITTPFTYVATSESIIHAGAKPVFVDIDPDTFNLDPSQLEAAITPQTHAIMPVHLYGQACDMTAILAIAKKHNLAIIEDCAQAIGAQYKGQKVGGLGDIGCFSFFPTKNLGALGDGGMLTTNDDTLAERLRMLRVHGSRQRYYHEESGLNSRLDELQAAVLRIKVKHLADWNQSRREVATRYDALLKPVAEWIQTPVVSGDCVPVFHQYTIRLKIPSAAEFRATLQQQLLEAGVQSMIYYPLAQYKQQSHAFLNCNPEDFPVCEQLSDEVLSLPIFPEITEEEQATVAGALIQAFAKMPARV